uniref:Uncharacterized protein n=1 Tax=Chromera velia CCMP2878 TaxID=1169474 RepID=A0A0G4HI46_9ALVE|eukprot:Cvel_1068.t1-p1 / transcript=Cvel_1068.t1 / gene=Cvel_1068 / organism=Chromera_velia_CCMP2878 / gene_product=hypothetical protein / transcript_product=hypothetical protein / location=Cvel_scaffold34:170955-171359(-) / protein_length=96 / sequence_SO=supercontig / SO=protein_coding / is_pseudo=false
MTQPLAASCLECCYTLFFLAQCCCYLVSSRLPYFFCFLDAFSLAVFICTVTREGGWALPGLQNPTDVVVFSGVRIIIVALGGSPLPESRSICSWLL